MATPNNYPLRLLLLTILLGMFSTVRLIAQCNAESDSLALVALYQATDGDNWNNNTNWLVEGQPMSTWYGVHINDEGCVHRLTLIGNGLAGAIPAELGSITNLEEIHFGNNLLSGSIPSELANLTNLWTLGLDNNELTGGIPPELGNLPVLLYLVLNDNQLTGNIPVEIANLPEIELLSVSGNQLSGNIPPELGNLSTLVYFLAHENQLSGTIPPELGNLTLDELYLHYNQLTGEIPPQLGANTYLGYLRLSNNQLTGTIPPELGNTSLWVLDLSNNNLTGSIPAELADITNLQGLYLSHNQLTGSLPPSLGNALNISEIDLRNNQLSGCFPLEYTSFCDRYAYFTGNPGLPNGGDLSVFCAIGTGNCPSLVGQIIFDENQNCTFDSDEISLETWRVKATSSDYILYGVSDANGFYSISTPPGEYQLEVIPPPYAPYWEEDCTGTPIINVVDVLETDTVNFFPQAVLDCPYLTVDISVPFLRRCFDNTYTVTYCNQGTITAADAYVEIMLDELLDIVSTSIPISSQADNIFRFELGNIAPNQCESFQIVVNVSCDALLGQTLCSAAHIYPDASCLEPSAEWSGATVAVEGTCEEDLVRFTIRNTGDGDMLESQSYLVIEDGLILLSGPVPFILDSQQEIVLDFPANGSTYVCQASQVDNHPAARSMPMAFVEACGTNQGGGFSTGYVTQFPDDDNDPFVAIECQTVRGAYDPNDKRASPAGYGDEHYIDQGQSLEYHIRFQNTGTDTAFMVAIRDEISPYLDISTFRRGSSSHPYSVDILEGNTLVFLFEDILLVDSFTNEPGSHGFVKFEIDQIADLPLETLIENTAAIFFDFNEPVITNTTWHRLGEDFILLSAIDDIQLSGLNVSIMPNPMMDQARFQLSGIDFKNAQLSLYNIAGVRMRTTVFYKNEITIERGNLPAGSYIFTVEIDGQQGFVGKVIVQ